MMQNRRGLRFGWAVMGFVVAVTAGTRVAAQGRSAGPSGAETFRLYCSSCHGASGKGDGPAASAMAIRPADLTMIARRNGGQFDAERVARLIDGRAR